MIPSISAERILVIQFRMIGDVLLCTPVVRALRHHYPKSYIAFCAEPVPAVHLMAMINQHGITQ
jgi:ADP-heptose:LPS heptosyltransferase